MSRRQLDVLQIAIYFWFSVYHVAAFYGNNADVSVTFLEAVQ